MPCRLDSGSKYLERLWSLVFLPTRKSDKRSRRSRRGVGRFPASARHIWAEVARQTTRRFREEELGEVERFNSGCNVGRPSSRQSEKFQHRQRTEDFDLGTSRVHAFLRRIPKRQGWFWVPCLSPRVEV